MNFNSVIILARKDVFDDYAGPFVSKLAEEFPVTIIYTCNVESDKGVQHPNIHKLFCQESYISILETTRLFKKEEVENPLLLILDEQLLKYKITIRCIASALYLNFAKLFFLYNRDYRVVNHIKENLRLIDFVILNTSKEKELCDEVLGKDIKTFVISTLPIESYNILYQGVISYNHIDIVTLSAFMEFAENWKFFITGPIIFEEDNPFYVHIKSLKNVTLCSFENYNHYKDFFSSQSNFFHLEVNPLVEEKRFYYPIYFVNLTNMKLNEIFNFYISRIIEKEGLQGMKNFIQNYVSSFKEKSSFSPVNIVVFYDYHACETTTVLEHLESFKKYSKHKIFYSQGILDSPCDCNLELMDVIVIHYSVRISLKNYISPEVAKQIALFKGLKILFIQDEYENTYQAHEWIKKLGIQVVFTCVPDSFIHDVYPFEQFKNVKFINNLTGYIPENLLNSPIIPLSTRKYHIVYRGRKLPYWYGDLGMEKYEIGIKMKEICEVKGISADIESQDEKRIYGNKWYDFLCSGRATLGTESGANIFDFDLSLRTSIEKKIQKNPDYSYEEAKKDFLKDDGRIRMNQISPKIFQAITCKTALILYEGRYSNILIPDKHYIELKKDWSNIEDVLKKVSDLNYLEDIIERAYKDIVVSGKYSYKEFIGIFDNVVTEKVGNIRNLMFYTAPTFVSYKNSNVLEFSNGTYFTETCIPTKIINRKIKNSNKMLLILDFTQKIIFCLRKHPKIYKTLANFSFLKNIKNVLFK